MSKWLFFSIVGALCLCCESHTFELRKSIPVSTATSLSALSIGAVQYLTVANYNSDSYIYTFDPNPGLLVEVQAIPSVAAWSLEPFTIEEVQYLALGNEHANSTIYRWDGNTFVELQSIPTTWARKCLFFTIDGSHYLVIAMYFDGISYNIDSKIYRWDGSQFTDFQSIATSGAVGCEAFTIDGVPHLAMANHYNGSSNYIDSIIYIWDGNSFVERQRIPTVGAHSWKAFTIDGSHYLVVANLYDGSSFNLDSKIYRWDGSHFTEFQSIATFHASFWEAFAMDGVPHLAIANHNDHSKVYKWEGTSFAELQDIPTNGARSVLAFTTDEVQYLFFGGSSTSYIYWWVTTTSTTTRTTWTQTTSTWTHTTATITKTTTSTTRTTTMTRTTTTRTEPEGELEAVEFAFVDVGVLSLATLGTFLLVLSVPIFMARLFTNAGRQSQVGQSTEGQTLGQPMDEDAEQVTAAADLHRDAPGPDAGDGGGATSISAKMKRSPYVLAVNMFLESGNLISTLLYAMEAYQRATLIGFSVPCGSGILMPMKSFRCPSEIDIFDLPLCHEDLEVNTTCEADVQVRNPACDVTSQLNNCGKYDLYTMEKPLCATVGCSALSNFLWVAALLSFFATVIWTATFYIRGLRLRQPLESQRLHKCFVAFFIFLSVLMLAAITIGAVGGVGSVLAMALLCSMLPICAWSLAAGLAFLLTEGEKAIVSQAAGLEIPFFNALMALHLTEENVEQLNAFRQPLSMGLRVVEDAPELIIGILDLVYFGGAWYAWLGIGMSLVMVVVQLLMGVFLTCRQSAMDLARVQLSPRRRPLDRE